MKLLRNGAFLVIAIASQTATAAIDPASKSMGPVALTPTLNVQTGYDDNIFSATTAETDSLITTISPTVQIIAEDGYNAYRVQYQLIKGIYDSSSDDNYLDQNLSFDAHMEFSARSKLDLSAAYAQKHEDRGTGVSETGGVASGLDSPLEYDTKSLSFIYNYGATDATGRIVFAGRIIDKEYQNFRSITDQRDTDQTTLGLTFYYRVMPKTSLLFEARNQDINYVVDPVSSLDSNTWRYYVGATWEGTAKTTGTVKLGRVEKDFRSASREDFSGNSWEAAVKWEPLTHSAFDLSSSQSEKESTGTGDFIDSKAISIGWTHSWNDQLETNTSAGLISDEYKGTSGGREDDITHAGLSLSYDMRRWLNFGMAYTYQENDSNTANISFDRNLYMLSVTGSL